MDFWEKIRENQYEMIIALAIAIYTITLTWFTIAKHNTFTTYAWDLGIFDQGFWTTINQDRMFYYTCELHLSESGSFFGIHFSPILFTVIPIYYLHQSAETLLFIQSLVLGLSAYPIYQIAKLNHNQKISCILACIYLLNPALHGVNSYDFHVQAFLPLILGYVLYYSLSRKWASFIIAVNFALAVQEQVFYLMIAYSLFLVILMIRAPQKETKRTRYLIIILLLTTAIAWKLISGTVINYYNPEIPAHLRAGQHYAVLGVNDPLEIPIYALTHPVKVFQALNFEWYNKIGYLLCLFTPYLLAASQLPLYLLPTAPWFAISLLSNYPPYYRIGFQYSAYVIPFIYTGFITGTNQLLNEKNIKDIQKTIKIITILSIITGISLSPLSPLTWGMHLSPAYEKPVETTRTTRINQIIDMVPPTASILTQDNLFPHFSNRQEAYVMIPPTYKDVKTWKDAINWVTRLEPEYILLDLETDPHNTIRYAFTSIRQGNYQLLAFYDNVYLYKRDYAGETITYEPFNITYTYNDLIPQNMRQQKDPNSTIGTVLAYQNMSIQTRTLWYGPYEIVPKGNYTVTYTLKTTDNRFNETIQLDAYYNQTILNSVYLTDSMLKNDTWTSIELNFILPEIAYDLELRGILLGQNTTIVLDTIRIEEHP
ncbi:MAG: DUF2079 domain-containing protein [Candidatus Bathyarchaeota archaeon]|nr:DUF2079 domain-containing protein [Candidatus Bathyarchaeota archaeon]